MADEAVYTYASQVTLEASGGSAASDAFVAANDAALSSTNHSNFPEADFVLTAAFGGAPAAGTYIGLYRQDLNIDSTSDAPAPSASYPQVLVGIFALDSTASAGATYPLASIPLTKECQFSIQNKTAQNLSAGWVLKCTPKTLEPSA